MAARRKSSAQAGLLDPEPTSTNATSNDAEKVQAEAALHVARVSLRRFGGVGDAEKVFDFSPGANVITGKNASGKTSVLNAIRCALRITRAAASGNAHLYAEEPPEIAVTLRGQGRELLVRVVGDESPTVREIVGDDVRDLPRPVQFIKDLVDVAGADAQAFEKARPDEQAAMLLEALDFEGYSRDDAMKAAGLEGFRLPPIPGQLHPLEDLEYVVRAVEDARRATGNERDAEKAMADKVRAGLPAKAPEDVGAALTKATERANGLAAEVERGETAAGLEEKAQLAKVAAAHETATKAVKDSHTATKARLFAEHDQKAAELRAEVEKRIAELARERDAQVDDSETKGEARLDILDADMEAARSAVAKHRDAALEALREKRDALAAARDEVSRLQERATTVETDRNLRATANEAAAKADTHAKRWESLDAGIKGLKRYAAELAGKAPIPGLEVGFDEKGRRTVSLDGKPLEKLSGSEMTALSARVAALRSRQGGTERPLKLILLDEIGDTTLSNRQALLKDLTGGGAQVIACLASEETADVVVKGPEAA